MFGCLTLILTVAVSSCFYAYWRDCIGVVADLKRLIDSLFCLELHADRHIAGEFVRLSCWHWRGMICLVCTEHGSPRQLTTPHLPGPPTISSLFFPMEPKRGPSQVMYDSNPNLIASDLYLGWSSLPSLGLLALLWDAEMAPDYWCPTTELLLNSCLMAWIKLVAAGFSLFLVIFE